MSPEVIPLFPTLAVDPKVIGEVHEVALAEADAVAIAKPLSVINRLLGTVAAEPISAVKLFEVLVIAAAETIITKVSKSLIMTRIRLLLLEIRSIRPVLLKLCLC